MVLNNAPPYTTIVFPIAFTTQYTFITSPNQDNSNLDIYTQGYTGSGIGYSTSKIGVTTIRNGNDAVARSTNIQWLAIGY
jgi:hypothetical protein